MKTISREELTKLYCEYYKIPYNPEVLFLGQMNVSCKLSKHTGIFCDELNRASPDVKGASLQLILDRQIHQHKLPIVNGKKCLMVAAINPDQSDAGEYQVQELDPAMLDRMLHVEAEVDVESWLNWARDNNVNACIREFIAENNEFIYNTPKDGRWATPRSWTMLAKHIDEYEKGLIPEELLMPILSGQIGSGVGTRVFSFIQNYSKGLKIEEITKVANEGFSKNQDIEETALKINELFTKYKIDQIVMQEKTEQLVETLLPEKASKDDLNQVVPMYAMLYALPIETLASIIYNCRDNKPEKYKVLATMDTYFNSKGEKRLFMKLLAK